MTDPRTSALDDRALVAAARQGDRRALEVLLRRHHDRIRALCRRVCGNDADADDATQDALVAIVRGLDRFDGRSAFSTWTYRIATNACLDELRRRRRRPEPRATEDWPLVGPSGVAPGPDGVADRIDVRRALAELPDDFRVAVVLRDLCDLDYAEIGEVLDIPPGTVRSRIARGRAQLSRHLAAGNPPTPPRRQNERP
ncbi:MAG: RNA polymerase sigma factor [Acidimicrobiia bacterium]